MRDNIHYRWVILLLFGALVGVNQMLMLNFAPLVTTLQSLFGASDFMAGLPTLLSTLSYLVFGFHAGITIDRHGYQKVTSRAAVLMAASAMVRAIEGDYWILLLGHVGITVAGVYITSAIAKVVSDWFPAERIGIVTGIVMAGLLIGAGVGMGMSAMLVSQFGFYPVMISYGVLALLVSVPFILLCQENPLSAHHETEGAGEEVMALFKDKNLFIVFTLSFLMVGATNGFNAWFEKIMSLNGFSPDQAGYVVGTILLFSIVGAALIPAFSDRVGRRSPFIVLSAILGLLLTYPLLSTSDLNSALGIGALGGLFQVPSYILIIALSAEISGPARAGLANSIVMFASSLGGLLIALIMERVGVWFGWQYAVWVMVASYFLSLLACAKLTEPSQKTAPIG